ncbi:hypothetical protein JOF53_006716 [Crossiella equi]|uniref:Uncharacterized protein n=1 Tax=Crossiella equi TaxID=130796 RepID=A0ABS5AMN5_9PSEU|nr:hypothetical protein [Crossiella equi]
MFAGSPEAMLLTTFVVVALVGALLAAVVAAGLRVADLASGRPWVPDLLGRIADNRYLRAVDPDAPGRRRPRAPGLIHVFA